MAGRVCVLVFAGPEALAPAPTVGWDCALRLPLGAPLAPATPASQSEQFNPLRKRHRRPVRLAPVAVLSNADDDDDDDGNIDHADDSIDSWGPESQPAGAFVRRSQAGKRRAGACRTCGQVVVAPEPFCGDTCRRRSAVRPTRVDPTAVVPLAQLASAPSTTKARYATLLGVVVRILTAAVSRHGRQQACSWK